MQCSDPLDEYLQKTHADDGYDNGDCDKNDFVDVLNFHKFFRYEVTSLIYFYLCGIGNKNLLDVDCGERNG